ncbi:hypothetical protein AnigIFM50267_001826 [Aspergillus niger]|nr:hypothetical protein AnigIFM50267_001826 [Aspergillus niger]
MSSLSAERKMIVGVDFGTEKTCVSYALWNKRRPRVPDIIKSFAISRNHVFPTMLAYLQDKSVAWAHDARNGKDPVFEWLKLFLYDQEHPILRETPNPALPDGVSSERLVSDYLRQLYARIQKLIVSLHLSAEIGTDFWFSRPAGWSADNQEIFAKAVRDAGFTSKENDNLFFLTEAEAAALYLMHHEDFEAVSAKPPKPQPPSSSLPHRIDQLTECPFVKPEDGRILVCDIGGGTTDVGAFHIQGTGPDAVYEPLGKSSGVNCGVAAMDAAVRQHVKKQPPHTFGLVRPLNEALLDMICDLKCQFDGTEEDPIPVDVTGLITVPPGVLRKSLNSTVVAIIELIMANIVPPRPLEPPVSVVFITGGGSRVPYLIKQIRQRLEHMVTLHHLDQYEAMSVSWGATFRGILGRAIPRLKFDASYGLQAAEEAIVRKGSISREQSFPHWFIRKDQAVEIEHQNELFLDIHYRAGDAPITIINLLQHAAEFPDANDGGDEYCVQVRIVWKVTYSERHAIVKFTAQSENALLGEQEVPLVGYRLVA